MSWLQTLLHGKPVVPACALLLLQRGSVSLDLDSILDRVEPEWGRSFSSGHPYWYSSSADPESASFLAGGPMVLVNVKRRPDLDSDKETPELPPLADRAAWGAYSERLEISCANDRLDPRLRFGVVAKMALAFLNENCTGIYDSLHRQFLPATPQTVAWLRECAASMGPLPQDTEPALSQGIVLLVRQPLPFDDAAIQAGVQRGFGGRFPNSSFWDLTFGRRPSLMADGKSVYFRQGIGPASELERLLPPPAYRAGWPAYGALLAFTSMSTDTKEPEIRQGAIASAALGFLGESCVGAYDVASRNFSANPAEIYAYLRGQAALGPQAAHPRST